METNNINKLTLLFSIITAICLFFTLVVSLNQFREKSSKYNRDRVIHCISEFESSFLRESGQYSIECVNMAAYSLEKLIYSN